MRVNIRKESRMSNVMARGGISVLFLGALCVQVFDPGRLDTVAVVLLVLAAFPWAASFLETAELPGGWRLTLRHVAIRQEAQERQLEIMRFLIAHFANPNEREHLRKLRDGTPFPYGRDETRPFFESELRRLLAVGLIQRLPGQGIRTMGDSGDLREYFSITEEGRRYLDLLDSWTATSPTATPSPPPI
jgi:hypothetical protein